MKKVLFSLVAVALCVGMVGAAFAQFSDTETSTGNTFTAGTLDLVMDVNGVANGTFSLTNIRPHQDYPVTLACTNVGTVEGWVTMKLAFAEADNEVYDADATKEFSAAKNGSMEMSTNDFAKLVYIKQVMQYDTAVSGGPWDVTIEDRPWGVRSATDTNGDGKVSLYEFQQAAATAGHDDCFFTLTPKTITLVITFCLGDAFGANYSILTDGTVSNVPQADGVAVTITATLDQRTSW